MKQVLIISALGVMALVMDEAQAFLNSSPLVNRRSPRCFRLKASECSRRLGAKRVPTMKCAPDRDDDDRAGENDRIQADAEQAATASALRRRWRRVGEFDRRGR